MCLLKTEIRQLLKLYVCAVCMTTSCVGDKTPKRINIGIFLNEDDYLDELVIKSSTNFINYYAAATQYFVNPIIHRIKKNEIYNVGNTACEMLEAGIVAIFGPDQPQSNEIIQSVALSLKIPQFQAFWNPNFATFSELEKSDPPLNFNLHPSPMILSKAFATIVRDNDWKTFTVIYEKDDGLVRVQEIVKSRSPENPPVTYWKLGPGPDHRPVLKQVVSSAAVHIILDCDADHIIDILQQAKEVKLFEEYHTYLLTSLDAYNVDFASLGEIKTNVSIVQTLDRKMIDRVVRNWELIDPEKKLKIPSKMIKVKTALLYDALNLFISAYSLLDKEEDIVAKSLNCHSNEISTHGSRFGAFIARQNISRGMMKGPVSGHITFNSIGQRDSFKMQIIELKNLQFRVTGIWDSLKPEMIHSTITSEDREKEMYQQLKNRTFKVVSRIYAPYLSRKVGVDGGVTSGNEAFEGYAMDLMEGICKLYQCRYIFEIVPDGQYGRRDPKTKKWNGLIRHLLDRKADLAICDLTTTYERRTAVDFSNPFMTLGISILYAKVVKEPPELLAFTNPLSLDVWLYMVTAYMVISMIIFLVARLNPNEWENPHPCDPNPEELENIWSIKNCFWLTLGSIMQQGCDILPKGVSTRLVTGMWWFFTLIMISCYTANLAAFLTQERMGPTIKSAEDLASQTKIKYGCLKDGATASFFKDTNISLYHKMWVQMETAEPSVFEESNGDGVKRVISNKGKYAFLMESSSIEYEIERHCELVQVGQRLDTKGYGIAMPTNAPYRTSINQAILKMQEMGELQRLKEKWWKEKNKGDPCTKEEKTNADSTNELSLAHVGGVFVVLIVGMVISLMIAVCEFLWNVRKIAVAQKMSLKEVFVKELRFAMDIWCRQKPTNSAGSGNVKTSN